MRSNIARFLLIVTLVQMHGAVRAQDAHTFTIPSFEFESGPKVPNTRLVYKILGTLNAEKSNAVLLPSHYMASHDGYDYLIGPGKTLDPAKYYLILTNMFANGVSSSPSNTPEPFKGRNFPAVSIRDNVNAQFRLIKDSLGISKLKAVVGFSMGGQQAYQWTVSHPEMTGGAVIICSNAKQYPFGIVRLQSAIAALKADGTFNDGKYATPPTKGLRAFGIHFQAWTRPTTAWPRDFFDAQSSQAREEYLNHLADDFVQLDANNLLSQAETWKNHDVSRPPGQHGNIEATLRSISTRVLLMPCSTDQYFPVADSVYEARFLPNAEVATIQSDFGHPAGGGIDDAATRFMNGQLKKFLESPPGAANR